MLEHLAAPESVLRNESGKQVILVLHNNATVSSYLLDV